MSGDSERLRQIRLQPLTRNDFAPFGDVISVAGAHHYPINVGTTERYHDLARLEAIGPSARQLISIFRGQPRNLPMQIAMMERHPLGSQAFFPLQAEPWIVVVAPDESGKPGTPVAFRVEPDEGGLRGVNYRRNVWHHALIALEKASDFLVVDRGGEGNNLEEYSYPEPWLLAPS
jgi:ureidoglycolate lyase